MDELLDHRRHLPMEGARNIRDLGGYSTTSGTRTQWQRFLRADNQANLTQSLLSKVQRTQERGQDMVQIVLQTSYSNLLG